MKDLKYTLKVLLLMILVITDILCVFIGVMKAFELLNSKSTEDVVFAIFVIPITVLIGACVFRIIADIANYLLKK